MTVPVTIAMAKTYFSKLKLIKKFLQSSMPQERLSSLALLLIENERAKNLDFRKVIQQLESPVQKQDKKISSFQPPASKLG